MIDAAELPHVDEHATEIAAGPPEVWAAAVATVERSFSRPGAAAYARLIHCDPAATSGPRPLATGSDFPGFRVTAAVPESELVLVGRHRFSTYALILRLEPVSTGRTRLQAETRAVFPGLAGHAYRMLVIGSHGHAVGMRRLLSGIKRRAENTRPENGHSRPRCSGPAVDGDPDGTRTRGLRRDRAAR
jgi:hypothetical protein